MKNIINLIVKNNDKLNQRIDVFINKKHNTKSEQELKI